MSVKITTVTTLGGHLHVIYTKISTSLSYILLTNLRNYEYLHTFLTFLSLKLTSMREMLARLQNLKFEGGLTFHCCLRLANVNDRLTKTVFVAHISTDIYLTEIKHLQKNCDLSE